MSKKHNNRSTDSDYQSRPDENQTVSEKFVDKLKTSTGVLAATVATGLVIGAGAFIASRYHVCAPHQYLSKTGLGIRNISTSKTAVRWPLQMIKYVGMNPRNDKFTVMGMTKGSIDYELPIAVNYSPVDPFS